MPSETPADWMSVCIQFAEQLNVFQGSINRNAKYSLGDFHILENSRIGLRHEQTMEKSLPMAKAKTVISMIRLETISF